MPAILEACTLIKSTRFSAKQRRLAPQRPITVAKPGALRARTSIISYLKPTEDRKSPFKTIQTRLTSSRLFCTQAVVSSAKPRFSFATWRRETVARLKAKKAQVLLEYGSTFIFLHETLGIASYFMCFGIASSGILTADDIVNFMGIVPEHIKEYIALKSDSLATTAVSAYIMLKCFDFLGLTPLRWAVAITLTPRIAWWLGPRIDRVVAAVKRLLPGKRSTPPNDHQTIPQP